MVAPQILYSAISCTVHAFLADFSRAVAESDRTLVSGHLTPDCIREFGPAGYLDGVQLPRGLQINNTYYEQLVAADIATVKTARFDVVDLAIDTQAMKAAARTAYAAELCDGATWDVDFTWAWDLNDEGTRIEHVYENLDADIGLRYQMAVFALNGTGTTC